MLRQQMHVAGETGPCPGSRCRGWLIVLPAAICLGASLLLSAEKGYPAPAALEDGSQVGVGIRRSMGLMASSTPQRRNKVKVLFYGQSITAQAWWHDVADDLRRRFPYADLDIQNKAIGGFSSQYLVRIAEHDLYPYYPDLLIFHVYGDHRRYEDIIRSARQRTTADIAIYTDHLAAREKPNEDGEYVDEGWTAFMAKWLIENGRRYNCEMIDIRPAWKRYLRDNNLTPPDLLRDEVHLNDHGCYLMAELIKRRLVYDPKLPVDSSGTVKTYVVGEDISFEDGKLTLEFVGNRVDAIAAAPHAKASAASVLIDGKKPSQFPQLYVFTRPSRIHGIWPAIIRVSWDKPLILEDWRLHVTESDEFGSRVTFDVHGSKTGFDGTGSSEEKFVSNSGRVVIEPQDWHLERTCKYAKKPVPKDFTVTWTVTPMFVDEYFPTIPENEADLARENATTLAQGFPNGKHALTLTATGDYAVPVRAIRVYRPPLD